MNPVIGKRKSKPRLLPAPGCALGIGKDEPPAARLLPRSFPLRTPTLRILPEILSVFALQLQAARLPAVCLWLSPR